MTAAQISTGGRDPGSPIVSKTRSGSTAPYAAGAAIGDGTSAIWTFPNAGPAGGLVAILAGSLRIDIAAVPSGMTTFPLELYDAAPDAILDGAAWALLGAGDRGKYLGFLTFSQPVAKGGTLFAEADMLTGAKIIKLAAASTSLFGVLRTSTGYTPNAGAVYTARLFTSPV